MGIQFAFALQNANVSRILQTFGAQVEHLSWFWLAAPLTGMIVQPIVGHYSDRTWTKPGRRRPYFLAGALLTAPALVLLPNSASGKVGPGTGAGIKRDRQAPGHQRRNISSVPIWLFLNKTPATGRGGRY